MRVCHTSIKRGDEVLTRLAFWVQTGHFHSGMDNIAMTGVTKAKVPPCRIGSLQNVAKIYNFQTNQWMRHKFQNKVFKWWHKEESRAALYWPDAEGNLQQGAQARHEKNGVNEVTLSQAVMLQTQPFWENERDGDDPTKCCQIMLQSRGIVITVLNWDYCWHHSKLRSCESSRKLSHLLPCSSSIISKIDKTDGYTHLYGQEYTKVPGGNIRHTIGRFISVVLCHIAACLIRFSSALIIDLFVHLQHHIKTCMSYTTR